MDAVTYFKTKDRMCKTFPGCGKCPANMKHSSCDTFPEENPEEAVAIVEKWLAEHPLVTYADKMREAFPKFDTDSVCLRSAININCVEVDCDNQDCCEACWNREYGSLEEK